MFYVYIKGKPDYIREYDHLVYIPRIGEKVWFSNEKYKVLEIESDLDGGVVYITVKPL